MTRSLDSVNEYFFWKDVKNKFENAFRQEYQGESNIAKNSLNQYGVDIDKNYYVDYNGRRKNITNAMLSAYAVDNRVEKYFKHNHTDSFYELSYDEMEQASSVVSNRISENNDGVANDDKYIYEYNAENTEQYTIEKITEINKEMEDIVDEGNSITNNRATLQTKEGQDSSSSNNESNKNKRTSNGILPMASEQSTSNNERNGKKNNRNLQKLKQESENNSGSFNLPKNHKQQQLDIIQKSNPMQDDYHTGIRDIEDIKTFEEAIEEDGGVADVTPDYKEQDVKKALETGKITVYSSYPIENGVFVTPSKMEAQSYAGSNQVYSKEVNLSDVAWIDNIQGQYAKADTKYSKQETVNLPKTDNKGNMLSKQQQEYFKDSKVRDENTVYAKDDVDAYSQKEYISDTVDESEKKVYNKYHTKTLDEKVRLKSGSTLKPSVIAYDSGNYYVVENVDYGKYVITDVYPATNKLVNKYIEDMETEVEDLYGTNRFGKSASESTNVTQSRQRSNESNIAEIDEQQSWTEYADSILAEYKRITGKDYIIENKGNSTTNKEAEINSASFNLPKTDNKGNMLSKEQQEYFKDSKVRDENGKLKPMYHGTEANVGIPQEYWFTIFDGDRQGDHGGWFEKLF